jgi:hypothetical protein
MALLDSIVRDNVQYFNLCGSTADNREKNEEYELNGEQPIVLIIVGGSITKLNRSTDRQAVVANDYS